MSEAQQNILRELRYLAPTGIKLHELDPRSVKALAKRNLIRVRATKHGSIVTITAAGKRRQVD